MLYYIRLREILMAAGHKVKTPHVIVPVLPEQKRRAERLQKKLSSVKLSEVYLCQCISTWVSSPLVCD